MPDAQRLRIETAQRIAADIAENFSDWASARARALDELKSELGLIPAGAVPSSSEIESAVRAHYDLFSHAEHAELLKEKRLFALSLLQAFENVDIFLTGAVLNGCAHADSIIVLDVFTDDVKAFEAALIDHGIDFEPVESPHSAMPDPLESLGALIYKRGSPTAEAVRFDLRPCSYRNRNPFRRKPDAYQQPWEAQGRISAQQLRQVLF